MIEVVRELSPEEWAATLLQAPRLTKDVLVVSLQAAIERGAAAEREACAQMVEKPWCPSPDDIKRIHQDAHARCEERGATSWDRLTPAERELMIRFVYATLRAAEERGKP